MKMNKSWEDLPVQEQVKYEEIILRQFPNLTSKELEAKAKKYYESSYTKYK